MRSLLLSLLGLTATLSAQDIVIYGGTSGGITAAIQAAREGRTAVLIEPTQFLGGLTTGGLGATDIGNKRAIGGIARCDCGGGGGVEFGFGNVVVRLLHHGLRPQTARHHAGPIDGGAAGEDAVIVFRIPLRLHQALAPAGGAADKISVARGLAVKRRVRTIVAGHTAAAGFLDAHTFFFRERTGSIGTVLDERRPVEHREFVQIVRPLGMNDLFS